MDQLLKLQSEQATPEKIPFPCNCPVYICKNSYITSHGIVDGIFLKMSPKNIEVMYSVRVNENGNVNVNAGMKDEKNGGCIKNDTKEMVHVDQLRMRNGCPVDVDHDERTYRGMILGTCDVSSDRRKYTDDKFWYSIEIVECVDDGECDDEADRIISSIIHEVSPRRVRYRIEDDDDDDDGKMNINTNIHKMKSIKEEIVDEEHNELPFGNSNCQIEEADTEVSLTEHLLSEQNNERNESTAGHVEVQENNQRRCKRGYDNNDSASCDVSNMKSPKKCRQNHDSTPPLTNRHNRSYEEFLQYHEPPCIPTSMRGSDSLKVAHKTAPQCQDAVMRYNTGHLKSEQVDICHALSEISQFKHRDPPSFQHQFGALISFPVPKHHLIGGIIGPRGSKHKELIRKCRCYISFSGDDKNSESCSDNQSKLEYGVRLIQNEAIQHIKHVSEAREHFDWIVENSKVKCFGKASSRGIQVIVGDKNFPQDRSDMRVQSLAQPRCDSASLFSPSLRLVIPDIQQSTIARIVIGAGGCEHKRLLRETGCTKIRLTGGGTSQEGGVYIDVQAKYSKDAKEAIHLIWRTIEHELGIVLSKAHICEGNIYSV